METEAPSPVERAAGAGSRPAVLRAPVVVIACSLPDDAGMRTHPLAARHIDGVERIAAAFQAVDPVVWAGDRAWLSFARAPIQEQVALAWRAAKELWQRGIYELDLEVRVAVMLGAVDSEGAPVVEGQAANEIAGLLAEAAERRVAVSEDVALCLRAEARSELTPVNARGGDGGVYVFPADSAQADVRLARDLSWWSAFEEYALSSNVREVHYVGFRLPRRAPPVLDLLDVFVPPGAMTRHDLGGRQVTAPRQPIEQVLKGHPHLVVLGEPGAGKTTLLKWLAVVAAKGYWPVLTGEVGPRLPMLVSVGRLAEALAQGHASFTKVLASYFGATDKSAAEEIARFLARQLALGRCAVLLDGLDETRARERAAVEQWLQDFAAEYPLNRFVATSRFVGYSGLRLPADARVAQLAPISPGARQAFVRAFCRAYLRWETGEDRPEEAEGQATALLQAIEASDRLSSLAQNPFMLSALALIHRAEGRLPRHRVQAYQMFLRALCETWSEARKLVPDELPAGGASPSVAYEEEAIPVLGDLALAMHNEYPNAVAPVDFVRGAIAHALRAREEIDEVPALAAADAFLKRAGEEVQILLERGAGQWGFLHLTFQEFFVAAGLHANERFDEVALAHLLEPRWEEVIRLGVGYLALVQTRPVAAQRFLEKVLDYRAPEPWAGAAKSLGKHIGFAALLAVEAGEALPPRMQRRIADEFAEWYCGWLPREIDQSPYLRHSRDGLIHWLRQIALSDFVKPLSEALLRKLTSGDAQGKARAAQVLSHMNASVSCGAIVEAFERDADLSFQSFYPLLARSASNDELIGLTKHPDERVRIAVARAAKLRSELERPRILQIAAADPSPAVREIVADELSEDGGAALVPFLDDPSEQVRTRALLHFEESTDPSARAAERRLVRADPSPHARRQAATNLARMGELADLETALLVFAEHSGEPEWDSDRPFVLVSKEADERVTYLLQAINSDDAKLRATAAFILGDAARRLELEDLPRYPEIEAALVARVTDEDPLVRRETLKGLDVRGDRAFEAALAATNDPDPDIRVAAYGAVSKRGHIEPVVGSFIRGLDDPNPDVRALCLIVLQALSHEERVRRFETAVRDPSPAVRMAAAQQLHLAGDATESLSRRLLADPAEDVRSAAVHDISYKQLLIPIDALIPLLNDPNRRIVSAAARALALGGDEGMRVLVEHADKPEARVALWQWAEARGWEFPA
jgi:HEAT repeat protein